jgi:hypothetical protein
MGQIKDASELLGQLRDLLQTLKYRENWVNPRAAWTLAPIGCVIGCVSFLGDLPFLAKVLSPLLLALGFVVIWWIAREIYWRTGTGKRIGLCFDGGAHPPDDWVEVRNELAKVFENTSLNSKVSLRVFPPSMTDTQPRWERTERRFRLHCFFRMIVEESVKSGEAPRVFLQHRTKLKTELEQDFLREVLRVLGENRRQVQTKPDLARFYADTLFDVLLFNLGVIELAAGRFSEAEVFLERLIARIATRPQFPKERASDIRWLHCFCLLSWSRFAANRPLEPEELLHAIKKCEEAVEKYGLAFLNTRTTLTRDLYFLGDLDRALEVASATVKLPLTGLDEVHAWLNLAVLLLLTDDYEASAAAFRRFLATRELRQLNLPDIIEFADCATLSGYRQAIFMRWLYRHLGRYSIDGRIRAQLVDWLNADPNRRHVQYIYKADLPDLSGLIATQTTKHEKRGRSKKRGKRKHK